MSKQDQHAVDLWGGHLYMSTPKSVFATIAWHLSALASENADDPDATLKRFCEELVILQQNGIIPLAQANAVVRGLKKEQAHHGEAA